MIKLYKIRWLFCVLLFLPAIQSVSIAQTTYYVAATGNDRNTGRSVETPFRSIAKVNSLSLVPGDTVLFRRGDMFRGGIFLNRSGAAGRPIVFDAYGTGTKPVVSGSVPVLDWINIGSNLWQASCPGCGSQITGLYRNGVPLPLGRYPNADASNRGYLTVQDYLGNTQVTSQQTLTTDWTGGEMVIRPTHWIIDRAPITRQSGNTLTLANTSTYLPTRGWGFFIQNHPATLDQPGEWYYNPISKTIRLYNVGEDPNDATITATTMSRGIDLSGASFISLRNLHITETLNESLLATNVSSLTVVNSDFTCAGENGVTVVGTGSDIRMENCTISDINNNGFEVDAYQNLTIRGNRFRRIGLRPGRGRSGDGHYMALQSHASQVLIENNVIDSVGYNGITFWNNTVIRHNVVSNFCMTKTDGGGLYVWNKNKRPMGNIRLESNIVHSGVGALVGSADEKPSGAHGIFLDDCAQGIDLINNTIFGCHGLGIYLHAVSDLQLQGNTVYNNDVSQLFLYNNGGLCDTRRNRFSQNIFLSTLPNPFVAGFSSGSNDLAQYGTFSRNYYARPFDDTFTIRAVYNQTIGDDLALPQWQTQFGHDLTSKTSPIAYKDYTVKRLDAAYRVNQPFDRNRDGWDYWSPYSNGRAIWESTNRLDKGSIRIDFPLPTGNRDSYVLVYNNIRTVAKSRSYLLRFDAVATSHKKLEVFIRQRDAPYQDLTRRCLVLVGPGRKQYELAFTATADEANALLTFQTREDGQTLWMDNIRLQDATLAPVNPDEYIRLIYNPTAKDSLLSLPYRYRDVKNRYWGNQVVVKPFSSVTLLRDSLPPVDVRLSLQVNRSTLPAEQTASVSVRLHNESGGRGIVSNRVQWSCRLPASLSLVSETGAPKPDNVLTGMVQHLVTDTTFMFQVKSTSPGTYTLVAEVTASTYGDPDSTPDSGPDDGEDDTAKLSLTVTEPDQAGPTTTPLVTALGPASQPGAIEPMNVFPNPAVDGFTFQSQRPVQALRVVDMLGREWVRYGTVKRGLPLQFGHQLPAGNYLLHIQYTTGDQTSVKLLKEGR